MSLFQWFLTLWNHLLRALYLFVRSCADSSWTPLAYDTDKKSNLKIGEELRQKIYCTGNCDLHDILRITAKTSWPEWQLKIHESHKTIEITEQLYKNLKKLDSSSSIAEHIRIIEETFLQFMPDNNTWDAVRKILEEAREKNSPELVIKAYTYKQDFTRCLNHHLAANSHHFLKLYCTIQNCPILSRTQEYTEAFTTILTHPKLDQYFVSHRTVYRGAVLDDEKFIESCQVGNTILTTTLLSTSVDRSVALRYCARASKNSLSVLWIFEIKDDHRCSALNIETLSKFSDEKEVLILRYVPFTITSIQRDEDQRINIYLTQFTREVATPSPSTTNNDTSFPLGDNQYEPEPSNFELTEFPMYSSCCRTHEIVSTMPREENSRDFILKVCS